MNEKHLGLTELLSADDLKQMLSYYLSHCKLINKNTSFSKLQFALNESASSLKKKNTKTSPFKGPNFHNSFFFTSYYPHIVFSQIFQIETLIDLLSLRYFQSVNHILSVCL